MTTSEVHRRALTVVRDEVASRDAEVYGRHVGRRTYLVVPGHNQEVVLRVVSRTRGDWQVRASDGDRKDSPETHWAFVDLAADPPLVHLAVAADVRQDIRRVHRAYLERHGGQRARNPASDHHRITMRRVLALRIPWAAAGL